MRLGKESEIFFKGQMVPSLTVQREIKRHRFGPGGPSQGTYLLAPYLA